MNKRIATRKPTGAELREMRDQRQAPGPMLEAARRAQSIRDGLNSFANAIDQMADAYNREDWKTLGYTSWKDYCEGEFGPQVRLTVEQRRQAAASLASAGLTKRAAAAALGVSHTTVQKDAGSGNKLPLAGSEPQVKTDAEVADEVARAHASFDEKYSGDVGPSLPDVPGESPPADIPTSQVALVAGQPGSNSSDAPVSEGPAGESTANRPGMTSSLARDEVTPPTSGPVGEEPVALQPVVLPSAGFGVFTAGDEEGRSAGPDLPSDPASELMRAVDGLAAALRDVDYDVAGPMLTDTEFKRFDELVLVLPGSVKLLRRWASAA